MTWLTLWDTDVWPYHDHAEHETREEAVEFARKRLGEVAVVEIEESSK